MEPAFQAGDGRPHHLFFLPHCAQRSGGPFYLIDSGRLTHRLPSSTPHLRRGPDGPWRLRRPRWCRLAVPEKNRRGSRCPLPLLKPKSTPDTPAQLAGSAFTQPKSPVQKEGVYGGTWFPRQIARGPRCGAALHFRRNAAIVGGWEAPLLEGVRGAAFGRKDQLGRASRGMISGQRPHLSLSRLRRQLPRQRAPY